jgi:hypothetical protein
MKNRLFLLPWLLGVCLGEGHRSDESRHIARTASTKDVKTALLRLAARFDRLADKVQLAQRIFQTIGLAAT